MQESERDRRYARRVQVYGAGRTWRLLQQRVTDPRQDVLHVIRREALQVAELRPDVVADGVERLALLAGERGARTGCGRANRRPEGRAS